jgi:hypothetical protein
MSSTATIVLASLLCLIASQ